MQNRRALLVGIEHYNEDAGFRSLPVVRADIATLSESLMSSGYEVDSPVKTFTKTGLQDVIKATLARSVEGETLIVYYSGHGVHHRGCTYLVPSDGGIRNVESSRPYDPNELDHYLVPLTFFKGDIERCKASNVIFLIDACREGLNYYIDEAQGVKGSRIVDESWTPKQLQLSSEKAVWFVYSCSAGGMSSFGPADGFAGPISYFTMAISKALSAESQPSTMPEVVAFARQEIAALKAVTQDIRDDGERPPGAELRAVCECKITPINNPWLEAVASSSLLQEADPAGLATEFRTTLIGFVSRCCDEYKAATAKFPDDPWIDQSYAVRVLRKIEVLVNRIQKTDPGSALNIAERSALVCSVFLREAVYASARLAAISDAPRGPEEGWDDSPQRAIRVLRGSVPRINRKNRRLLSLGRHVDCRAINAWILHRSWIRSADVWLVGADKHLPQTVLVDLQAIVDLSLSPVVSRSLQLDSLVKLSRVIHSSPERLFRHSPPNTFEYSRREVGDSGGETFAVREQLLGGLICIAGWLAIDVRTLDAVLIDHFGLSEELRLEPTRVVGVVSTQIQIGVPAESKSFEMQGDVPHAAIDRALRVHAQQFEEVLRCVSGGQWDQRQSTQSIQLIPRVVTTSNLLPSVVVKNGKEERAFATDGKHVQFRLSDHEVTELLMGERLYGDPTLAFRELYQNALDACRYREARLTYLDRIRESSYLSEWKPQIEFTQGTDDQANSWVKCRDNGIGMNRAALEHCFAKAGSRFADSTDFLEEQANWLGLSQPVEFFPNSQFGIGVFSYFMLADEIRIRTRRTDLNGSPERVMLDVRVSGSGSLFHIREVEDTPHELKDGGTEVTLLLARDTYVDSEGRIQRISVHDTIKRLLWIAEFPTTVIDGDRHARWEPGVLQHPNDAGALKSKCDDVWWVENREAGRVLCDGVATEDIEDFIVVNLRRQFRPEMTVDRRRVRVKDPLHYSRIVSSSGEQVEEIPSWMTYEWFWAFSSSHPEVGLKLLQAFERGDEHLYCKSTGTNDKISVRLCGCNYLDSEIVNDSVISSRASDDDFMHVTVPLYALLNESNIGVRALRTRQWRLATKQYNAGFELDEANVPSSLFHFLPWTREVGVTLSAHFDGQSPWLNEFVHPAHLLGVAHALGEPVADSIRRLSELAPLFALKMPDIDVADLEKRHWSHDDAVMLSERCAARGPWIEGIVSVPHIMRAAAKLEMLPSVVYHRLVQWADLFGFDLSSVDVTKLDALRWSNYDESLLSEGLDGGAPWLEGKVGIGHLLAASNQLGQSAPEMYDRLLVWADVMSLDLTKIDSGLIRTLNLTENDCRLLSKDVSGSAPWLKGKIDPWSILVASERMEMQPIEVVHRLTELAPLTGIKLSHLNVAGLDGLVWSGQEAKLFDVEQRAEQSWSHARITIGDVLDASDRLGEEVEEVLDRFCNWSAFLCLDLSFIKIDSIKEFQRSPTDRLILSSGLDESSPWLEGQVGPIHVARASARAHCTVGETCERLNRWSPSFNINMAGVPVSELQSLGWSRHDGIVLARDWDDREPWVEGIVSGQHLFGAALKLREPLSAVYERLLKWAECLCLDLSGLAKLNLDGLSPSRRDALLLSVSLNEHEPWITGRVELGHIVNAAVRCGESAAQMIERLKRWAPILNLDLSGINLAPPSDMDLTDIDSVILSRLLDGQPLWITAYDDLRVFHTSWYFGIPIQKMRARFERLGTLGLVSNCCATSSAAPPLL